MRRISLLALLFALGASPAITAQGPGTELAERSSQRLAQAERTSATKKQQRRRFMEQRRAQRTAQRQRQLETRKKRQKQQQVVRKARGFRRLKVDGAEVRPAMEKLATELDWHDSLQSAQRVAKRTGKPIVWIHALGDLTGVL